MCIYIDIFISMINPPSHLPGNRISSFFTRLCLFPVKITFYSPSWYLNAYSQLNVGFLLFHLTDISLCRKLSTWSSFCRLNNNFILILSTHLMICDVLSTQARNLRVILDSYFFSQMLTSYWPVRSTVLISLYLPLYSHGTALNQTLTTSCSDYWKQDPNFYF